MFCDYYFILKLLIQTFKFSVVSVLVLSSFARCFVAFYYFLSLLLHVFR